MRRIHLIGIGGSGLSAIARVLIESGYSVSGSDRFLSPMAKSLQEIGAQIFIGHQSEYVRGADLVIRSSAIPDDNVEILEARANGIPVLKRADFLRQLMVDHLGIAIAGTHGKTTTTAMIAWVLSALGQDPTFIIGGISKNLGTNARAGKGKAFVIEADEYDRMFLGLQMQIAVVTNVEYDHPDCYPTSQSYQQAFREFIKKLPDDGLLLACVNEPGAALLLQESASVGRYAMGYGVFTPGTHPSLSADVRWTYQAINLEQNQRGGLTFEAIYHPDPRNKGSKTTRPRSKTTQVSLQIPGEHNVCNALAAMAVTHRLGLSLDDAAQALYEFSGTGRRFDVIGEEAGISIVDDYAHHPTEIRTTIQAARMFYPGRQLWVVWQPHTYSRTRMYFEDFVNAFESADHVLVTEVYAAREALIHDFSAQQIVSAMHHTDAHFVPDLAQATTFLLERLRSGDVLLVLSAGDADQISANVLLALEERKNVDARS